MTHPAFTTTLSADELDVIQATADVWRSRGYGRTADNLLAIAGLAAPAQPPQQVLVPAPRLAPVTDLSTYRHLRHGGAA